MKALIAVASAIIQSTIVYFVLVQLINHHVQ